MTVMRRTPNARIHEGLGATMALEGDWELPVSYGDEDAERSAIRDGLAIADITARGKIDARGEVDGVLAAAGENTVARSRPAGRSS